jgi:hypothetical protein
VKTAAGQTQDLRAAAAAVSAMLLNFLDEPNGKAKPAL